MPKYCIVPMCFNSTVKTPDKLFFPVPREPKMLKTWMTVIRRKDSIGPNNNARCCEDHFDIEKDMENYVKYKLVGGKLKLKKEVVPHKFECQQQKDIKPKISTQKRKRTNLKPKRFRKVLVEDEAEAGPQIVSADDDRSLYVDLPNKSTEQTVEHTKSSNVAGASAVYSKSDELHEGFTCNSCYGPITGFRYTCVQCADYDLCSSCEARGEHCLHYVLRIPSPRPYAEIQCVLSKIRTQLLYGADKETEEGKETHTTELPEEIIKVEVKEELPDPLETEGDAFQADDDYTETHVHENKAHSAPTDESQPSHPLNVNASTLTLMETDKNLLIIENPVSASSAASHAAAAADGTKRRLAHRSTQPPHLSEKRARVTHAPAQGSANLFLKVPITGNVHVPVLVPQAVTTIAPRAIVAFQNVVVKEEPSFQVFSHIDKIPQDPGHAESPQTTGKASASSRT